MIETKFKNTEIGLIPEDWQVKTLGEIGEIVGGGTPSTSDCSLWDGGSINWFTPAEIGEEKYVNNSIRKINELGLKNSAAKLLPVGTILLTTRASIGFRAILTKEATTNQGFQSIITNNSSNNEFIYYIIDTIVEQMKSLSSGSTFMEISSKKLKSIQFPLPPLPEQRRIAEVLSQADELIKQWENVIAKKRDIKTATMQLLLTGKKRLNGFKDEWVEKKFEEIFVHISSRGKQLDTKDYLNLGKYPIVDQGQTEIVGYTDAQNPVVCPQNGIIIFGDHTRIFKYVDYDFYVGADGTQLLTTRDDYSCLYLYYSCLTLDIPNTGYNRHFKYLKDAIFFIPPTLSEQRAIAEILSDMDEEIKTLEAKVEKLRNIKSGMMQQLLSGKIRLTGDDAGNVRQFVENNFGQMPYAAEDEAEFGL